MSAEPGIQSFSDVIGLWPTLAGFAQAIGATTPQVTKWRQRDNIPAEWWLPICSTGTARDAGVTPELLARFAARGTSPEPSSVAPAHAGG